MYIKKILQQFLMQSNTEQKLALFIINYKYFFIFFIKTVFQNYTNTHKSLYTQSGLLNKADLTFFLLKII